MGSSRFAGKVAIGLLVSATAVGLSVSAGAASAAPQTIDVQTTTIHDGPGYDDETGVGTPAGPAFFTRN